MAAPYFFSNVAITIESALAAADTITGITKASPGVVTATSHGISDGSFVLIECEGMVQMDNRIARVDSADTNTFALEGIDTTDYGTFSSGTAKAITFGTTLSNVTGLTVSGGDAQFEEWQLIQDTTRRRAPVAYNPWSLQFECLWDPADTTLAGLLTDADTFEERCVKIAMSGGYPIVLFRGYVGTTLLPEGNAQGLVRTRVSFDALGRPTYYAAAQS